MRCLTALLLAFVCLGLRVLADDGLPKEWLEADRLASMKDHDSQLEPDVQIMPDRKSIVVRGNFQGSTQAYIVEVKKGK